MTRASPGSFSCSSHPARLAATGPRGPVIGLCNAPLWFSRGRSANSTVDQISFEVISSVLWWYRFSLSQPGSHCQIPPSSHASYGARTPFSPFFCRSVHHLQHLQLLGVSPHVMDLVLPNMIERECKTQCDNFVLALEVVTVPILLRVAALIHDV